MGYSKSIKMSTSCREFLITGGILLCALAGNLCLKITRGISTEGLNLSSIPMEIGEWQGKNLSLPQKIITLLGTKNILMREYKNTKGEQLVLAIVSSSSRRDSFHPPELCYLGSGAKLLDKRRKRIKLNKNQWLEVNQLIIEERGRKVLVWYWFTAGGKMVANYYYQQLYLLKERLRKKGSIGTLIRISTPISSDNLKQAGKRGRDFIIKLLPVLTRHFVGRREDNISIVTTIKEEKT